MASQDKNIKAKVGESVTFHTNLNQHGWIILEDKVRLTLIAYEKQFEKTVDWWTPLSILVTILVAILTTEFEDFWFIPKDTMRAMFYMAAIYFFAKTLQKGYNAFTAKRISIDDVIKELRESSEQQKSEDVLNKPSLEKRKGSILSDEEFAEMPLTHD